MKHFLIALFLLTLAACEPVVEPTPEPAPPMEEPEDEGTFEYSDELGYREPWF